MTERCCLYFENNSKTYLKEFDKVFLCWGAISTSSIVMNFNIPEVEIKTSDMISFPYFTIFRKGNKRHSLSDMFLIHESKKLNSSYSSMDTQRL